MGFIAGYVSRNGKIDSSLIEQKAKSYHILVNDDPRSYDTSVIDVGSGHLIHRYKPGYPVQSKPQKDQQGNHLVTLGFLSSNGRIPSQPADLEESSGEFVCLFYEAQSGDLHIVNDRFASRPFYILREGGRVYFSSNLMFLLFLAGGRREPDVLGWFQIVGCDHTCGTRTNFRDVHRLRPATHLTISADASVFEKQYWRLEFSPAPGLNAKEHSLRVFEAFAAGTESRAHLVGRGVIALSGGLDSRLVAASLPKDAQFSAFTFINSPDEASTLETRTAGQVSRALNLTHRIRPVSPWGFSDVVHDVIRLTGGQRPFHHMAITMQYIHELEQSGLSFLLGGGPGDIVAGSKIRSVDYLDSKRLSSCIRNECSLHTARKEMLGLYFRDDIVRQYHGRLYSSFLESFEEVAGPTPAHRVTAWSMLNRWPAFTFTSVMHNHPDVSEAFCHLDYAFCDLMLKLPAEWLYKRNFYAFMIYQCLPHLRNIVFANTGKPLSGELVEYGRRPFSKRAVSSAANFARSVNPRTLVRRLKPVNKRPATHHHYYNLFKRDEKLLGEVQECLFSIPGLGDLLDIDKADKFVCDYKSDALAGLSCNDQAELMGTLVSICLSFKEAGF